MDRAEPLRESLSAGFVLHEGRDAESSDENAQNEKHPITVVPDALHTKPKKNHASSQTHPRCTATHAFPPRNRFGLPTLPWTLCVQALFPKNRRLLEGALWPQGQNKARAGTHPHPFIEISFSWQKKRNLGPGQSGQRDKGQKLPLGKAIDTFGAFRKVRRASYTAGKAFRRQAYVGACSSGGQSSGLLIRGSGVRILPGAPAHRGHEGSRRSEG